MTNGQIVITLNIINKIKESDRKLPIRLSYALNKNLQTLMDLYKPYAEAIKEYGNITQEKLNSMSEKELQDFTDLYNTENDVDLFKVELKDIEDADLTINELEVIQTFMMD